MKFKVGDRVVIVNKYREGRFGKSFFIEDIDIDGDLWMNNEQWCLSEDELEFDYIYNSPLYKALE
jgi:hypothetical protein